MTAIVPSTASPWAAHAEGSGLGALVMQYLPVDAVRRHKAPGSKLISSPRGRLLRTTAVWPRGVVCAVAVAADQRPPTVGFAPQLWLRV